MLKYIGTRVLIAIPLALQTPRGGRLFGIGLAIAGRYAAEGATVVVTDRKLERAEKELNMTAYMVVIYVAFFVFLAM